MVRRGYRAGSVAGGQTQFAGVGSDGAWLQASELRLDTGLGPDVWALALPLCNHY
jgi:hypothetical protein